jgi:aspartate aminotransferase
LFLIADEVYREFTYDGDIHYSVMNIPGLEENAIMIDRIKRYSMCGARIGCIVSKKQRANGHRNEICTSAIEPPTFAQS